MKTNIGLWVLQVLLALFFAFGSGGPKLFLTPDQLAANMPIPLPQAFIVFIGLCEIAGAIGLILPWATGVKRGLTPLAAACLALLTVCAAIYHLLHGGVGSAAFAIGVGLVCAFVAYGRLRLSPGRQHAATRDLNAIPA